MQHKLINTGDYLLIVDDSKIKEGDLWYNASIARIWRVSADNVAMYNQSSNMDRTGLNKIIAHLPLNNSPILEGVDLLPPLEDEVEKLANETFPIGTWNSESVAIGLDMFILGYNKAKDKYKYTEEDLRKAITEAWIERGLLFKNKAFLGDYIENYIQSLQQPKMPVAFLEKGAVNGTWVGEYIY